MGNTTGVNFDALSIHRIQWEDTISLRHSVLWPNKDPSFCFVQGDQDAFHYGAYVNSELVSVASIYIDKTSARLRKFATNSIYQGKGIGSCMIRYIIADLQQQNIILLWCDARETARHFYERLGMSVCSERFYKSEIAYLKMSKHLTRS
ncbi:GNAT family N-acetyltransferase [Aestuariibacter sp. GS-14]|uniref:GNAT family N-acetyltransferase n=1 Tax=Aestuariibacter sp. GS-14 TaxID=2590670 RepID=UPI001127548E|nr:GNAT family N-acetyltransferase [Aestuariibacter sp. GS-14]TPV59983.1 GNAT family N-acetyltransferase [Aestuariibacter sp. GS-14]